MRRSSFAVAAAVTVTFAALAGVLLHGPDAGASPRAAEESAAPAAALEARDFAFGRLNRSYTLDDARMEPVRQGPVTIRLSSPDHVLVVRDHRVRLEPLGDGTYRARIDASVLGRGDLVADLDAGAGAATRMTDQVVLLPQDLTIEGRVAFARVEGGWDVTAHELPAELQVLIESRLGLQIASTCAQVALFLGLDCTGLDRAFTRVTVPLPPPGSVFFLPASELEQEEIERLDRYLGFS